MKIDKENFKQILFDYFSDNYEQRVGRIFAELKKEFPYDNKGLSEEFSMKNFTDWLMIEKQLPDSGKTVVEEFIENNPDISKDIKNCMAKMKNIVKGGFKVLSYSEGIVILKNEKTGKEYKVKLYHTTDQNLLKKGYKIKGRIHEFDDYHRFAGIFTTKMPKSNIFSLKSDELMEWFDKNET